MAIPTPIARAAGRVLGIGVATLTSLRRTKPLHPQGSVVPATLTTWGGRRAWGASLLDDEGSHSCLVRVSRAVGLPNGWPDIGGLAIRVPEGEHVADLLFATTGTGLLGRYVLLLRRDPAAPLTTLLPLRSRRGPVQLRLDADGPHAWVLSATVARSPRWDPLALLQLHPDGLYEPGEPADEPVRFDPVRNIPRGLAQYPAVRAVREPGYTRAQREPVRAS